MNVIYISAMTVISVQDSHDKDYSFIELNIIILKDHFVIQRKGLSHFATPYPLEVLRNV